MQLQYESTTIKLEYKNDKLAVEVDKNGEKVLKDSPLIYIDAEYLLREIL